MTDTIQSIPEQTNPPLCYYFYKPLSWFLEEPTEQNKYEYKYKIKDGRIGIGVHFTRDGLIVFDFSEWPEGESVTIPAYEIKRGKAKPKEVAQAENKLIEKVINRANAANVFQACLSSAIITEEKFSHPITHPINPSNIKSCHDIRSVLHTDERNFEKRSSLINKKTLFHATGLFTALINNNILRQLCVSLYKAHWEFNQFNYTGATIESWVVLEKLINMLWEKYITSSKTKGVKINSERKEKLTGRDFSASIITEILSLAIIIDNKTYNTLTKVRQARNHWMHGLKNIQEQDAINALNLSCELYSDVIERDFKLPISKSMQIATISNYG